MEMRKGLFEAPKLEEFVCPAMEATLNRRRDLAILDRTPSHEVLVSFYLDAGLWLLG